IEAAQTTRADNPALADGHISTANRMLKACRTELRQCLWDLRSEALEDCDFAEALLKVCTPVAGDAKVAATFSVPRSRISDATAHSLLCIARELVSNAVRHGHATNVRIAGELRDGKIRMSVGDNGSGFIPDEAPNQLSGHFGLTGIRERVKKLGGELKIESKPGSGTQVVASVPLPGDNQEKDAT
ncbi:MAG: ATP-binding protein, partial [Kiritimatiellae bacterium]|nr:ATP-binding protein [Kiritimatiellia bacterium]